MANTYAARLKKGVDYGVCGTPEYFDTEDLLEDKIDALAEMISTSKYIVVHTGAGVSTSCGIPDFRGPNGVWTRERNGIGIDTKNDFKWEDAIPSLTHMSLLGLQQAGKIKFLITQNVDGLHLRSGFPKSSLAELHGNVFAEKCERCGRITHGEKDVQSIGFSYTGNICYTEFCKGKLRDMLLDWDDALPENELEISRQHCMRADLSLCLGTSLRVQPANTLPIETVKNGGRMVICNLQKTPKDSKSHLLIRGKCDQILSGVMERLKIPIPLYKRNENFVIIVEKVEASDPKCVKDEEVMETNVETKPKWKFEIHSKNDNDICNYISKVTLDISSDDHDAQLPIIKKEESEGTNGVTLTSPFKHEWETSEGPIQYLTIKLHFIPEHDSNVLETKMKVDSSKIMYKKSFERVMKDYNILKNEVEKRKVVTTTKRKSSRKKPRVIYK